MAGFAMGKSLIGVGKFIGIQLSFEYCRFFDFQLVVDDVSIQGD